MACKIWVVGSVEKVFLAAPMIGHRQFREIRFMVRNHFLQRVLERSSTLWMFTRASLAEGAREADHALPQHPAHDWPS